MATYEPEETEIPDKSGKLRIVTRFALAEAACDNCKIPTRKTQQMHLDNKPVGVPVFLCLTCDPSTHSI